MAREMEYLESDHIGSSVAYLPNRRSWRAFCLLPNPNSSSIFNFIFPPSHSNRNMVRINTGNETHEIDELYLPASQKRYLNFTPMQE